ncbi:ABC transporter ATP-binding protein [Pseudooceanicola spongiae]|jgi:peptide/nickel transport system ATP-binding protein|uniref:ATP-binding cassette domain-containing protein n=1 Tax=Pseudooceanicola spongiae TaxID=2613965 RepID=A0A7L9WNY1_9RHOB|nr:ABC transporter ATP-binding protein [Pseudooceanicola spongiae]QOL81126.1 ATP-binding cassette domain-containing protein [Pseudooceanicola spongiae]
MTTPLLSVRNLEISFRSGGQDIPVVRDLSFDLSSGEILGIVGESGCGKSITALSLIGLVPSPPGRISGGQILFQGEDLVQASQARLNAVRGNDISMVFQEPMTSLNPVFSIGEQIAETARAHFGLTRAKAWARAVEMLALVGIPSPAKRAHDYPHQLSGGMRQRVMIAIALVCEPKILIADEPTTALDVTVQAQIFDLFQELQQKIDAAIILITHDIGVVAQMTDRVMVMYAGRKIEEGPVTEFLGDPRHPYTRGLISCIPRLSLPPQDHPAPLFEIPGVVPAPKDLGRPGCAFAPRCAGVQPRCHTETPALSTRAPGRAVACWLETEDAL